MFLQFRFPGLLSLRALLVSAALICLCVSSNVGLQFFPLPVKTDAAGVTAHSDGGSKASHSPLPNGLSFRVPMMVQSKKRADSGPVHTDAQIPLPVNSFRFTRDTRLAIENVYIVCPLGSATVAPDAGRAPPSLV